MKFILLINVKMPTIAGILSFISRINDLLVRLKPVLSIDFFMNNYNFVLSWVENEKKSFITSGPDLEESYENRPFDAYWVHVEE